MFSSFGTSGGMGKLKRSLQGILRKSEFYLTIIFMIMVVLLSCVKSSFGTLENAFNILRSSTFIGICSIGVLVVLICAGTDISFTATATVAQYAMALMIIGRPGVPIVFVILLPVLIGMALGCFNALLLNWLKVPAIIICIAMLNAYYGAIQVASNGEWLYGFPEWFVRFPNILLIRFTNTSGVEYGLSTLIVVWFAVALITSVILKFTKTGRNIYALGGNAIAATREGINVNRTRIFAFGYLGAIAGIGAIAQAMITQTSAPNALVGQEFDAVAAVVLGGASIIGGGGTVYGTILGVIFIAALKNGLTVLGVPSYWHQVFIGFALVISICVTATREKLAKQNAGGVTIED